MEKVCYHCFQPLTGDGPCPRCGYDAKKYEGKYPFALRPGAILNGRYIVGRVLGQGGFGITYVARDYQTGQRVAVKEYFPTELAGRIEGTCAVSVGAADRQETFAFGKGQFLEEARTLAQFRGIDGVVQVYSYFEENGTAYFSMEYVDGMSLKALAARRGRLFSVQEAEDLLLPVMDALSQVHALGIVHRDISPDNIIVRPDGSTRLIDFGAARYSTGEQSKSLDVILKHGFAPMEQYARRGRQGPWTDVYAMAATFYYLITGHVPPDSIERFSEDTLRPPSALGADIRPAEEAALLQALAVSAPARTQSMAQLHDALQAARAGAAAEEPGLTEAMPLPKSGSVQAPQPQAAPKKKRIWIPVAAVLAAAAIAAGVFLLRPDEQKLAYREAEALLAGGDYAGAREAFLALGDYKDSAEQAEAAETELARQETELAYQAAAALLAEEKYAEAAEAFRALGDYKDSAEQAEAAETELAYRAALEKLAAGEYDEAEAMLEALRGYKDVDAILDGDSSPQKLKALAPYRTVGNIFSFGSYEQDNDTKNGPEPIEWIVLDYDEERGASLVISRYLLDGRPYDDSGWYLNYIPWTDCTLRKWLNGDFFSAAFSEAEQSAILPTDVSAELRKAMPREDGYIGETEIQAAPFEVTDTVQDQVTILSESEVEKYLPKRDARFCEPTVYATGMIRNTEKDLHGKHLVSEIGRCWWMRSCTFLNYNKYSYYNVYATPYLIGSVTSTGDMQDDYCTRRFGIRPAIWLDLNALADP